MIGAAATLLSGNVIKRVAGLLVCGSGAIASLAALGAGNGPLIAGVALLFVYVVLGVAIVVRLQESYGAIEAPDIDTADAESDVQERAP
jgi:hypothetical protein